jgi:hypothetical protein
MRTYLAAALAVLAITAAAPSFAATAPTKAGTTQTAPVVNPNTLKLIPTPTLPKLQINCTVIQTSKGFLNPCTGQLIPFFG